MPYRARLDEQSHGGHHDSSVMYTLTLMRRRRIHRVVVINVDWSYGIVTKTDIRDKIVGGGATRPGRRSLGPAPRWSAVSSL